MVYYLYEQGSSPQGGNAGVAAALQFIFLFVVTLIQIRYIERRVTYAA
jgi:ABC-type sugar transport system permease subunit